MYKSVKSLVTKSELNIKYYVKKLKIFSELITHKSI